MKTLIEMAHEVYGEHTFWAEDQLLKLKAFADLVRADERKANIGCIGRIAAMVVDPIDQAKLYEAMDAIRARSNT